MGAKFVTQMVWYGYSRSLFTHEFIEEQLEKAGFSQVDHCSFQQTASPYPGDRGARQPRAGEPLRGGGQIARVLFYRDFKRFTGGDLKVWDYFNHVRSSPRHSAHVRFSAESVWDATNPWNAAQGMRARSRRGRRLRRRVPVRHGLAARDPRGPATALLQAGRQPHPARPPRLRERPARAAHAAAPQRDPHLREPGGRAGDPRDRAACAGRCSRSPTRSTWRRSSGSPAPGRATSTCWSPRTSSPSSARSLARRLEAAGRDVQLVDTRIPRDRAGRA